MPLKNVTHRDGVRAEFLGRINYVEIDPRYFRPTEVNLLKGNYSKAKAKLSWEPKTNCRELAELMVDHDLKLASGEATKQSLV